MHSIYALSTRLRRTFGLSLTTRDVSPNAPLWQLLNEPEAPAGIAYINRRVFHGMPQRLLHVVILASPLVRFATSRG